jgi:hypothetical protein
MSMKERTHQLSSFNRYLNKGFALRQHAAAMRDARHDPEISPSSVFLALFHSFVFRLPSFQQLDRELKHSHLVDWIGAERPFGDDTLRYSLCGFHLEPLEAMLVDVNRRLKRGKAFHHGRVQGRLVAALDGIEVVSSLSRCCESCLSRQIKRRENGRMVEQTQYYHRAVGCQMVHSQVRSFLAIEWLRPGENEVGAALRLLRRLPELYGSRFFDILLLDALYAQSQVLDLVRQKGWDAVISLKQNCPELYRSAMRLFARRPADASLTERRDHKTYQCQIWDTEALPLADGAHCLRVVRSEEVLQRNRYRQGEVESYLTNHEWLWMTTLPAAVFSAIVVRRLGHDRWRNENNGWMDLTKHWAFKHGFLHACRHRPQGEDEQGRRRLVPNHGLAAVIWIALIAFTLSAAFVLRHSKLARIQELSMLAVADQLLAWIWKPSPSIRSPG